MDVPRKRGKYKQYLENADAQVPGRTLRGWAKKDQAAEQNPASTQEPITAALHHPVDDPLEDSLTTDPSLIDDMDGRPLGSTQDELNHHHEVCDCCEAEAAREPMQCPTDGELTNEEEFVLCDNGGFNVGNLTSSTLSPEVLDEPLADNLAVSKFETMLMIFHMALRHGMTWVFLEDMLKFVNTLVGVEDAIPSSKYLFQKLFMSGEEIDVHFYCPECQTYLGHKSTFKTNVVNCSCQAEYTSSATSLNGGHYFVTMSITQQLQQLLKRPDINLMYSKASERTGGVISDIYDGKLYKDLLKYCKQMVKAPPLTITFNTDGSPVFKSSAKNSLWPIQFVLNEVCPTQRFDLENVMLAGLWFGSSPNMDVFFKPFVDELKRLSVDGIQWMSDGSVVSTPVFSICCVTDSAARPKVQRHHLHNGAYGCAYCFHPGISTIVKERTVKLDRPVKQLRYTVGDVMEYPGRDDATYRTHMAAADALERTREKHVYGVLGTSPVSELPMFDLVFGFGIDYMHGVLEGVTKRCFGLWLNSSSTGNAYYIGRKIKDLDHRMSTFTPPSSCRQVRPVSDRESYKANDWRAILLYYFVLSFKGILPEPYFSHFKKLVVAVHILLKNSITYDEVREADELLHTFVMEYENLYGEKEMLYNVHLLLHLAKTVSMLGPLWAYSAFCFESGNGHLVKLVKGTTGVATQIATKYQMSNIAAELVHQKIYSVQDSVINFCGDVVSYRFLKNVSRMGNDIALLGIGKPFNLEAEGLHLGNHNHLFESFSRAIKGGVLYHAKRNSRQNVFDDSCVKLENGRYAIIDIIFKGTTNDANECHVWCMVKTIRLPQTADSQLPHHIQEACIVPFDLPEIVPFNTVSKKCILLNCDSKYFVCEYPNNFEKD